MIKVFIPTYKRDQVRTLEQFPKKVLKNTFIVVQHNDRKRLKNLKYVTKIVLPKEIQTIAPTRKWIGLYCKENKIDKFVMIDDDLKFFRRKVEGKNNLTEVTKQDIYDMFNMLNNWLDDYAHCGISAREGNGHINPLQVEVTRSMRVCGFRTAIYNQMKHCRMQVMEDFDITLQLLRKGLPNIVSFEFANNQFGGSGSKGGCSEFRTLKVQCKSAKKLAKLHPNYVKTVEKTTKGSWGGATRTDVRVQWKQAFLKRI